MILSICNDPGFLEIMVIVKQTINVIKIVAPFILIFMMMFDIIKAVTSGRYDDISKNIKKIPKRLIAAVMIFLVPTVLELLLNLIDEKVDYANCITNANYETIQNLYLDRADSYVTQAEETENEYDLNQAKASVTSLSDEELKTKYSKRLEVVQKSIENKKNDKYHKNEEAYQKAYTKFKESKGNLSLNKLYPYYNQCDARWTKVQTSAGLYDSCRNGCGYNSLSMVISGLKSNPDITPAIVIPSVIPFSGSKTAISDAALYSNNLTVLYNVKPEVLFYRGQSMSIEQKKQKIVEALKQNKPIVLLIPGHYIALVSISNNKISVLDPYNQVYNGNYTIDELYDKWYNYSNRCTRQNICGFIFAVSYSN